MSVVKTKSNKIIQRNERIRKRFNELTEVKHYKTEYALELLEKEFLPLEPDTLWLIISKTGYYKNL